MPTLFVTAFVEHRQQAMHTAKRKNSGLNNIYSQQPQIQGKGTSWSVVNMNGRFFLRFYTGVKRVEEREWEVAWKD